MKTFEAKYEVHDGYVSGKRPHSFVIDIEPELKDATDDQLEDYFVEAMWEAFYEKVHPFEKNLEEFIAEVRKL